MGQASFELHPNDCQIEGDFSLEKAVHQAEQCGEKRTVLLVRDTKRTLLRLINAKNETGSTLALENFILGFRLGMRLAIEGLDEDDGSLKGGR